MNELTGTGSGLSAAFDRLCEHSTDWSTERVVDEGLDLVRDSTWADSCALYAQRHGAMTLVAHRPTVTRSSAAELDPAWFPWGLAPVNPQRFLLIEDARSLPVAPHGGSTLGDEDVRSCLHLPILERTVPLGALHLFWAEPRLDWDDDRGRLLRSLGRFLLTRTSLDADADPCTDTARTSST
jgi:GAF domain-containing protein